jgi:hypothetical protein
MSLACGSRPSTILHHVFKSQFILRMSLSNGRTVHYTTYQVQILVLAPFPLFIPGFSRPSDVLTGVGLRTCIHRGECACVLWAFVVLCNSKKKLCIFKSRKFNNPHKIICPWIHASCSAFAGFSKQLPNKSSTIYMNSTEAGTFFFMDVVFIFKYCVLENIIWSEKIALNIAVYCIIDFGN